MQDAGPVCAFSKDRYQVPDSVAGLRSSALGLDKGGGKVVPPSPLIPPWPRAGYRGPSRGTGYLAPGTRDQINAEDRTPGTEDRAWPLPSLHPVSCIPFLTEHYRDCG